MGRKIVVVGGVAGGASAAARIRRIDESAQVIMFERGKDVSFSNCSLPFYLSGIVASSEALVMMNPLKFKNQYGIEARTESEVIAVNREKKTVTVKHLTDGRVYEESYDKLVLSPGAAPVMPSSIKGIDSPHVFSVRNVQDITAIKAYIEEHQVKEAAVIGGGFIGIEMAENMVKEGLSVSLAEADTQILRIFDEDMVQMLHKEMLDNGVLLVTGDGVSEIGEQEVILSSGRKLKAGIVIMAIGVRPETALAKAAGLALGETGSILTDEDYRTSDPDIYAVGDAIEVTKALTGKKVRLALAGPAQKQARDAADAIYGLEHRSRGVIGSSIIRVFGLNAASTGLKESEAKAAGYDCDMVYVIPNDHVNLMPGNSPVHFKLVYEKKTGRILGAQCIGKGNVEKRVDVIAAMITMGGTVEDLKYLEMCYAPLFGTAKDVVNFAALTASNIMQGMSCQVPVTKVRELVESGACIVDVREEPEYAAGHLKGAVNVPLSQLRNRMTEIPKDRPVYVHCRSSQRSYNALRALKGSGYDNVTNISGSFLGICLYEYYRDVTEKREPIVTAYNFN